MGKSRHGAADDDNTSGSQSDAQQQSLLELMLASMCAAVESQASQEKKLKSSLLAEDSLLLVSYREAMWKLPIEHALQTVNAWSLTEFRRTRGLFKREIVYPVDAKPAPDEELQQQQEDELTSSEQQQRQLKKKAKKKAKKKRWRPGKSGEVFELFRVGRIDEDPLEARWDHHGNPVPLRRNILGEHYAPRSDPLRFIRSANARSPSEIYQQMKRAVREDLVAREKRRIQVLNDREKVRKQQAGEPSPEVALEAKFDRMFVESSSANNNEPQESPALMKRDGKHAVRIDSGEENASGDDDTDEASDGESSQQQSPAPLRAN